MIRVDETDPVGEIEPSFPYRDVTIRRGVEFKDHYDIESEIGRGKFGIVYRCRDKANGLSLAAKLVNTVKKEDRRAVEGEVEIMRRLQHPRLIQLYDAIDTGRQIYVILELIEGGELFERVIDDDFVLTERSCAVFMRQICEGVEFIHAQNILHLDLKPENILCLTKEGNRIKIIDFGLARQYDPKKKLQVLFGTPEFVAPEVVNFDQIGFGTDMWSIGVICYILLSGLSPFMGDTDIETMANVTIAKYDFDHEAFTDISEDAKDFIRCLLVKDKEKRATAAQCRQHRWLARKTRTTEETAKTDTAVPEKSVQETSKIAEPARKAPETSRKESQGISATLAELDVTKDNLRLFVERWREHPDSPYTIETTGFQLEGSSSLKAPIDDPSCASLCAQDRSACASLSSLASETTSNSSLKDNRGSFLPVPSIALTLERRASDSTVAQAKPRDQASHIFLAEEIIRLSEHLHSIATRPHDAQRNDSTDKEIPRDRISSSIESRTTLKSDATEDRASGLSWKTKRNGKDMSRNDSSTLTARVLGKESSERNEIAEKLSSITLQRKLNGTTFHSSRSFEKRASTDEGSAFKRFTERRSSSSRSSDNSFPSTEENPEITSTEGRRSSENLTEMDLTPPWRKARVKKSFGETSRDVPRIAKLRDLHQSLNLDEPACTKDLLLRLLGEWGDVTTKPSNLARKSVSIDWCEDSVARRTINSLAEYFQSEQRKTIVPGVVPTPTTSVHR